MHLFDDHVVLDCARLRFVDPLGLCLMQHWFDWLEQRNVTVELAALPYSIESFMQRMDLFEGKTGVFYKDRTSGNGRNDLRGLVIEVRSVDDPVAIDAASTEIASALVHRVQDISFEPDPELMRAPEGERFVETLEYVFSEMLLNALDHGRKRGRPDARAKVAGQYYPRSGRLSIAIVDDGCGLLETLQNHPAMDGDISHRKAIEISVRPRVSCNRDLDLGRDSKNQGIGLTVSTQMAIRSHGSFALFSGDSWHRSSGAGDARFTPIPGYEGTGIYLEFDRAALGRIERRAILRELPGYREVREIRFG